MLILLGAVLVFFAIVFLVLGITQRAPHPMNARVAGLRGEAMDYDFAGGAESAKTSLLGPLGASLGAALQHVLPGRMVAGVEKSLVHAGQPMTTSGFLALSALVLLAMLGFAILISVSSAMSGMLQVMAGVGSVVLGALMPRLWLSNLAQHRQKAISASLPDAFDLITTCVEAGLGLEAALAKVAEKVEGPFGEELTIMLQDVALGKLRRDAMRDVAERTGVADLKSFINAVVQAETMGTSIAAVLRVQADQMRIKRRQRAEQQAQAAPIKMMFPLVLFIFPSLFIVILGPGIITLFEQLGSVE